MQHHERRELIIQVALDLLNRKGVEAITMRQVAQRLELGAMTLYTYVQGQDELCRAIIKHGFDMIHQKCKGASESCDEKADFTSWQAGARAYVDFAMANPSLYHLMFSMPIKNDQADKEVIASGFAPLRECVREQMTLKGMTPKQIDKELSKAVMRYWIALHGLASLAIAGRLDTSEPSLALYLDDLLERVSPT